MQHETPGYVCDLGYPTCGGSCADIVLQAAVSGSILVRRSFCFAHGRRRRSFLIQDQLVRHASDQPAPKRAYRDPQWRPLKRDIVVNDLQATLKAHRKSIADIRQTLNGSNGSNLPQLADNYNDDEHVRQEAPASRGARGYLSGTEMESSSSLAQAAQAAANPTPGEKQQQQQQQQQQQKKKKKKRKKMSQEETETAVTGGRERLQAPSMAGRYIPPLNPRHLPAEFKVDGTPLSLEQWPWMRASNSIRYNFWDVQNMTLSGLGM
jgi:hypothetical protein